MATKASKPGVEIERDPELEVDKEYAVSLVSRGIRSHEKGLPEWIKNAAGAYVRAEVPQAHRVVVLAFANARRGRRAAVACLDFVGMDQEDLQRFRRWMDPDAAPRGRQAFAFGGHGSGGKGYMVNMFDHAQIRTTRDRVYNCVGFADANPIPGPMPDASRGRDVQDVDPQRRLSLALSSLGLKLSDLPDAARKAFDATGNFTIVIGYEPRDARPSRLPVKSWVESVVSNDQMMDALGFCEDICVIDGTRAAYPLTLPRIEPVQFYEEPLVVEIPRELEDRDTGTMVSTTDGEGTAPGCLTLLTSKENMFRSHKRLRPRHRMTYRTRKGTAGSIPVRDLVPGGRGDRVYGTCHLEALEPDHVTPERGRLVASALTRALGVWIASEIEAYAESFEEFETFAASEQEMAYLRSLNQYLDQWKNQLLEDLMAGPGGAAADTDTGAKRKRGAQRKARPGAVARIEFRDQEVTAGIRVPIRPEPVCYGEGGERVVRPALTWSSSDANVLRVDSATGDTITCGYGQADLVARSEEGVSGCMSICVAQLTDIDLQPTQLEVGEGCRKALLATTTLADGEKSNAVLLQWESLDPQIVFVGPNGVVTGNQRGECLVTARDGGVTAAQDAIVTVVEDPDGDTVEGGSGPPRVLVAGIDSDPDNGEHVEIYPSDPPVHQRPSDVQRNIFWINTSCPLAKLYMDTEAGHGVESRQWRVYHLERYVDVLAKIRLGSEDDTLSSDDFIGQWEEVQVQMQESAARDLGDFIDEGSTSREGETR